MNRPIALPLIAAALLALVLARHAHAQPAAAETWAAEAARLATDAARAAFAGRNDVRVEVAVGTLDPRLRLAPCTKVDLRLPPGQRAWGRTRVAMRCVEGPVPWNVYVPLTVKVLAPALVAAQPLAAGTVLQADHLRVAEADWAAATSPVLALPAAAVGRTLLHGLSAGAALREADLKKRIWFAAGDAVRVQARGNGFTVGGEGVALTPGIEGQPVRVRTEAGRTIVGVATGERRVEVLL